MYKIKLHSEDIFKDWTDKKRKLNILNGIETKTQRDKRVDKVLAQFESQVLNAMLSPDTAVKQPFNDDLICQICMHVILDPQDCSHCDRLFCKACISKWLKPNNMCPNCRNNYKPRPKVHRLVKKQLDKKKFRCTRCELQYSYESHKAHQKECVDLNEFVCPIQTCSKTVKVTSFTIVLVKDKAANELKFDQIQQLKNSVRDHLTKECDAMTVLTMNCPSCKEPVTYKNYQAKHLLCKSQLKKQVVKVRKELELAMSREEKEKKKEKEFCSNGCEHEGSDEAEAARARHMQRMERILRAYNPGLLQNTRIRTRLPRPRQTASTSRFTQIFDNVIEELNLITSRQRSGLYNQLARAGRPRSLDHLIDQNSGLGAAPSSEPAPVNAPALVPEVLEEAEPQQVSAESAELQQAQVQQQ